MVKIKAATEENFKRIQQAKEILTRLHKGQQIIERAYTERSVALAFDAIKLYGTLSKKLFTLLEESLMISEFEATGKTMLINRQGRGVNIDYMVRGPEIELDPWSLQTFQVLKEVFGEEYMNLVEFVEKEQEMH